MHASSIIKLYTNFRLNEFFDDIVKIKFCCYVLYNHLDLIVYVYLNIFEQADKLSVMEYTISRNTGANQGTLGKCYGGAPVSLGVFPDRPRY